MRDFSFLFTILRGEAPAAACLPARRAQLIFSFLFLSLFNVREREVEAVQVVEKIKQKEGAGVLWCS